MRTLDEAELYGLKKAHWLALKYIQRDMDKCSADMDNNHTSSWTETMEGFMKYLGSKIDEYDWLIGNNKWGSSF